MWCPPAGMDVQFTWALILGMIGSLAGSTVTPSHLAITTESDPKMTGVIELKVGVIIIDGHGAPYDVQRSGAAIQMAFDEVNKNLLNDSYKLVKIERHYGPQCDAETAPGKSMNDCNCCVSRVLFKPIRIVRLGLFQLQCILTF